MSDSVPVTLPSSDQHAVLRVMPMPADANIHGDVFGGWIMAQVDIAASIPAAGGGGGPGAPMAGE
jgi:acyl-CoA thioesterase YciA